MSHEAGKREQGDSFTATNGHPKPPSNGNGGSIAATGVDEARSQSAASGATEARSQNAASGANDARSQSDISLGTGEYDMGSASQTGGDPLPPRHANYAPNTASGTHRESKKQAKAQTGPLEPPVTKATLCELDVDKIVHSPKLRHDINFDPALHFRPNLDGDKGRRKRQKASDFWAIMRKQLRAYLENREAFEKELGDQDWALPITLKAIREILETLVPQRDRASVEDTFNVDLLMQQFRKGVADLVRLATWLSQLIKCHCAPMRDLWVDEMVIQITKGSQEGGDVALLAGGISTLLGILEAMKLDVANHQIRCLRPLLIEDTVHFEQKFFMKKISQGRIDLASAHSWFTSTCNLPNVGNLDPATPQQANTWHFMKGLVNLALPSKSALAESMPHTFLFDEDRLIKLRADMEDVVNIDICMHFFHEFDVASKRQRALTLLCDDTPGTSFVSSPFDRPTSPDNNAVHSSPTLPLPHHFRPRATQDSSKGSSKSIQSAQVAEEWNSNLENDAISLSSAASPQSSPSSTASTPEASSPIPLYLSQPVPDSAFQVRSSLKAILDPSMTSERWTELASSLALEILRATKTPLSRLSDFESDLERHLSNPRSKIFQDTEQQVLLQLFPELRKLVETYTPLTCLQIFELAAVQKGPLGGPGAQTVGSREDVTEIATKIAHIGILHWRVWGPLAYLLDPDDPAVQNDEPMT